MMNALTTQPEKDLMNLLEGFLVNAKIPELGIEKMASNSQHVDSGDAFLAIKGVQRHGIDYSLNAEKNGATVILYDSDDDYAQQRLELLSKQIKVPVLGVKNLNENHGKLLSRLYADPSKKMTLIGVTGTDGKTSVTHLLTQALTRLNKKVASIGTLGSGIANQLNSGTHTTPDAAAIQSTLADFYKQNCEVVVMEVSSHALDQYRVVGCEFDIAVLTNLGSDHLDYHNDLQHYADAKERLFHWDSLTAKIVNADDPFGKALSLKFAEDAVFAYSASIDEQFADVRLKAITANGSARDLLIATTKGDITITSKLIGDFNIDNILAVVTALISLDYDEQQIALACQNLQAIPGRMQVLEDTKQQQVIIDFAHTAQALKASLLAAKKQSQGKLWCVFGCGGDRDRSKRAAMGKVTEQLADNIVITDDNPRNESPTQIVADILQGCSHQQPTVIHDRKKAIEFALSQASDQDTILIAGKGHEQFQTIRNSKIPFSDAYVAQSYLNRGIS